MIAPVPESRAALETEILRGVLDPPLFESFRLYTRALLDSGGMRWEEWGQRWIRHNDPLAQLLHEKVTPLVEAALRHPVRRSYVFMACYADGGFVPRHVDRAQCEYTLDLCLEDSGETPWPLIVDGERRVVRPNEGLLYRGCVQEHHREPKPVGKVSHLVFFHLVDVDFDGPLD